MRTVLIFDSSAVTCHTVSKQLRTYGFDTIQARSIGGARVALASKRVDLVILDLAATAWPSAPNAGGMTLLRELRRDRTLQNVPAIILTSSARDNDRIEARAAGAAAFLTKPVSTSELLVTVNSALALRGAPRQAERGPGSPALRFGHGRDLGRVWAPAQVAPAAAASAPPVVPPLWSAQ
jgi:DNA-binding response OmpR family regulator